MSTELNRLANAAATILHQGGVCTGVVCSDCPFKFEVWMPCTRNGYAQHIPPRTPQDAREWLLHNLGSPEPSVIQPHAAAIIYVDEQHDAHNVITLIPEEDGPVTLPKPDVLRTLSPGMYYLPWGNGGLYAVVEEEERADAD